MNFYKHHIGDYDADTAHLSMLEDAAYSRLMRTYYRTETPIPADMKAACRLVRAISKQERDAVSVVLNEFFTLHADGWHNKRCDEELTSYIKQAATNRDIAVAREAKRKQHDSLHDSLPTREPSHKPLANNQEPLNPKSATAVVGKESADDLASSLRASGVKVGSMNPHVIDLANQGVTSVVVREAVRIAREDRGKDSPVIGYLIPIINDLQHNVKTEKPRTMSDSMRTLLAMETAKNGIGS